jgi:hypothetical protein
LQFLAATSLHVDDDTVRHQELSNEKSLHNESINNKVLEALQIAP